MVSILDGYSTTISTGYKNVWYFDFFAKNVISEALFYCSCSMTFNLSILPISTLLNQQVFSWAPNNAELIS